MPGDPVPTGRALRAMAHEALASVTDDRIDVTVFDVQRTVRCPGAAADDAYRDTALMARRRVGLHALGLMQSSPRPLTPLQAVHQAMEDPPDTLDTWLAGLDEGGRAAVAREALVLVHGLRTQLRWPTTASIGHQPLNAVIGTVNLKARVDGYAVARARDRGDQSLLLTTLHVQDAVVERATVAFTAVVYGLMLGAPPRSVHVRCVATGVATKHAVGADTVLAGLSAASSALAALLGLVDERTPGPHCHRCTRSGTCAAGGRWLAARTPVAAPPAAAPGM